MSPLKARPPSFVGYGQRLEFTFGEFAREIKDHGYNARWSKAALCPNRDPTQEDHHRIDCRLCDHHGFIYYDPTDIIVLITSLGQKQMFLPESRYQPGMAYFTTMPEFKLSFWDKIELTKSEARFTQVIKVIFGQTTYKMKYPVISVSLAMTNSGVVIPTSSITVDTNGQIVFAANSIPDGTAFLTVSFRYRPVYIMIDLLHQVRDSRITVLNTDPNKDQELEFPSQAVGQLDFLIRDENATS